MTLFKKKPKLDLIVPHTDSFTGFKRIKLATYKDEYASKGIKALGSKPVSEVGFELVKAASSDGINVYANGYRIGTMWKHSWAEYYRAIKSGKVKAAHIDVTDPESVYLYIAL